MAEWLRLLLQTPAKVRRFKRAVAERARYHLLPFLSLVERRFFLIQYGRFPISAEEHWTAGGYHDDPLFRIFFPFKIAGFPHKNFGQFRLPLLFLLWQFPRKITSPASADTGPTLPLTDGSNWLLQRTGRSEKCSEKHAPGVLWTPGAV